MWDPAGLVYFSFAAGRNTSFSKSVALRGFASTDKEQFACDWETEYTCKTVTDVRLPRLLDASATVIPEQHIDEASCFMFAA